MTNHDKLRLQREAIQPNIGELETADARIRVLESGFDDQDFLDFLQLNQAEVRQEGQINDEFLKKLQAGKDGQLFKIMVDASTQGESSAQARELSDLEMAGFVSTVKVGGGAAEIVYALARDYRGKGIMGSAVEATTTDLRRRYIEVVAKVNPENKASIRLLRKAGYTSLGIMDGDKQVYYGNPPTS